MINYVEMGSGLHEEFARHGVRVDQDVSTGVWTSNNDALAQSIIDGYTLDKTKSEVCSAIDAFAAALREKITANVAPAEMASWPIKRAEALAYQADPAVQTPFLSAEAAARGVTVDAIVTRVIGNAAALSALEAQIAGNSGRHRDAVKGLADFGSVLSYDWHTGWPVV